MAHLRHANRSLHGPEVRVRQRDIHRLQGERMAHLPPVGGDHIGGGRQARRATELRHHFAAGEALLSAARILRIGQYSLQLLANLNGFFKQPGAVRIEGHAGIREALRQGADRFGLFKTGQHAALQLKVVEAIFFIRRFREADHRIRRHRLFMAQAIPLALFIRLALIGQRRGVAVTDKEQVAQHFNFAALLSIAEQRGDVDPKVLAQQVQQRRFDSGHHVNGGAQVKGLQAAAAGVTVGELIAHRTEHVFILAQRFAHHQRNGILQSLANFFAPRNFTDAGMAGVIFDNHDIAGEVRSVGPAQIHQHTVMAGNRDHLHGGDNGRGRESRHSIILL